MAIRIYNTLSKRKEPFEPLHPGKVGMYVCGPTVYDSCHIGHARSVVVFDVIVRYFRARGFAVTYVRNFTDVDDKIIQRANQLGIKAEALAEKYIAEFYRDMDALLVERATHEPRATEHIGGIIDLTQKLIEKNSAYPVDGDVYYAVESFGDYGKLSGRNLEDMEAGARVEVDQRKKNPFDFALWKAAKPGEPSWDSPWGKGRPGWHIECSAMSSGFLGETFDIHGGGKDLIFPHHENEIAQSEAASGKPFARYWIHNGFVNINQEKMSKSLGNFLMVKDVITRFHPEAVRLFLLSNHYRSPIDFSDQALEEAVSGLDKIYALIGRIDETTGRGIQAAGGGQSWIRFCEAMDDDFNTAKGIGILFEAVRTGNRIMDENAGHHPGIQSQLNAIREDILRMGPVLGIVTQDPASYFETKRRAVLETAPIDAQEIEQLVADRFAARKAKDWTAADRIRDRLTQLGIVLEDRADGTVWRADR